MSLTTLEKLDHRTAEGVLAAAALATSPDPGIHREDDPLRKYADQAAKLLKEIRERLRIEPHDDSPRSKFEIDKFLASALRQSMTGSGDSAEALKRAGQQGRLAPALYTVVQSKGFTDIFYPLGVSATHVDDAIKRPDDYQHLMTNVLAGTPDERTISLFMKHVNSRDQRHQHWLLVQTHRIGTTQVAQAAWRVYPEVVDLSQAATPLDALKAFVNVFGNPIVIAGERTMFGDSYTFPYGEEVRVSWKEAPPDHFWSISIARDQSKSVFYIGTIYCVDLSKYRDSIINRGARVRPSLPIATNPPKNEIRAFVNHEKITLTRLR
jgi:hypothetical protein